MNVASCFCAVQCLGPLNLIYITTRNALVYWRRDGYENKRVCIAVNMNGVRPSIMNSRPTSDLSMNDEVREPLQNDILSLSIYFKYEVTTEISY